MLGSTSVTCRRSAVSVRFQIKLTATLWPKMLKVALNINQSNQIQFDVMCFNTFTRCFWPIRNKIKKYSFIIIYLFMKVEPTDIGRMKKILDYIARQGPTAFDNFYAALVDTENGVCCRSFKTRIKWRTNETWTRNDVQQETTSCERKAGSRLSAWLTTWRSVISLQ